MKDITFSVVEIFISLCIESTLLAGIIAYLQNKANQRQEQQLKQELFRIETQIKTVYQEISEQQILVRDDLLNEIKERNPYGNS